VIIMPCPNRLIFVALLCLILNQGANASPSAGPFQGTFKGTAIGDQGSSAPLALSLLQNGSIVTGIAAVGDGIEVDTGGFVCPGLVSVPSGTIGVNGIVSGQDPRHLEAQSSLSASGLTIIAEVLADLSADHNTMNIQLKLNIPWPCHGTTIKGTLTRSG
jgi:hypothetical protein